MGCRPCHTASRCIILKGISGRRRESDIDMQMEEKEFDYINMVPFIDVMLVLLVIVLMTGTFVATGIIPVELPRAAGAHEKAMKTGIIDIDKNGVIYYQNRRGGASGL